MLLLSKIFAGRPAAGQGGEIFQFFRQGGEKFSRPQGGGGNSPLTPPPVRMCAHTVQPTSEAAGLTKQILPLTPYAQK